MSLNECDLFNPRLIFKRVCRDSAAAEPFTE